MAHRQGHFALDCWRLQDVSREARFVAGVTQRGAVADLIRGGLASSGVGEVLREARASRHERRGSTQLMSAASSDNVERVQRLFCLGCPNVNAGDIYGSTALHRTSLNGHEVVVRELLAQGADVNLKTMTGSTPLTGASFYGHLAVVRLLCDVPGIDHSTRSSECGGGSLTLTALGWALLCNHTEVAAFLRSRGAPD